jgi:hypothetical protein
MTLKEVKDGLQELKEDSVAQKVRGKGESLTASYFLILFKCA